MKSKNKCVCKSQFQHHMNITWIELVVKILIASGSVLLFTVLCVTYMWIWYSLDWERGWQGVLYGARGGRRVGPQDHGVCARALRKRVPQLQLELQRKLRIVQPHQPKPWQRVTGNSRAALENSGDIVDAPAHLN